MRHDLAIPARYGIRQTIGDTVGPGGITRALRNIPVLLNIARDMEVLCPDAWLLNVTNPMTTLCRAVTGQTSIKTVGLCHEITITHFLLSLLLDTSYFDVDMTVAGVNHFPVITELRLAGEDGFLPRLVIVVLLGKNRKTSLNGAIKQVGLGKTERDDALAVADTGLDCESLAQSQEVVGGIV